MLLGHGSLTKHRSHHKAQLSEALGPLQTESRWNSWVGRLSSMLTGIGSSSSSAAAAPFSSGATCFLLAFFLSRGLSSFSFLCFFFLCRDGF